MSDEEENEKSEDEGSPLMIEDVIIKKEVVVIGAGISGLSAAKLLHKHEVDVLVLEARDRVGGRTLTKRDSTVKYVDLGGSYVGPTQNRLLRLAKELEVENYVVNEVEKLLYYYKGKRRWYSNDSLPFSRSPLVILDLYYLIYLMDKHGSEIPVDAPWDAPHAKEWDNMTMKEWIDKHLWTTEMKDVMHLIVVLVVTQESSEVSALWFLWYIRQCDNFLRVISTTNGGQERKFIGGSQTISERMAEILKGSVILDKPVIRIMQNPQVVTAFTQDGNEYLADYIILATAPSLHMKIHWDPPLPPLKNQLAQRVPVGSVMKAILYYKTPFWRKKGFCGSAFLIDDNIPVILSLDDTKPEGTHAAIIGFVCGEKLRSILHLTKEARRDLVIEGYVKGFDCAEFRNCIHYEEKNWMEEQYSGGCYTGTYPPGVLTQFGKILREPFDRVYFAGTETGTHWSGYMEGAVESGERAAREVLYAMGKIRKDQIWQEEPESQDVPEKPFPLAFGQKIAPRPGCVSKMLKFLTFGTLAALGIYYLQKKEIITVRIN